MLRASRLFCAHNTTQVADACINATSEVNAERMTRTGATLLLVAQIVTRISCIATTIGMLSTTTIWHDAFLLQFCGVFAVSMASLILCLFFRVYRVSLAAFPSRFPTVLDFWASSEYCLLLIAHVLLSLLFYYSSISAAHRMGRLRYFSQPDAACTSALQQSVTVPSAYAAIHLASMRR